MKTLHDNFLSKEMYGGKAANLSSLAHLPELSVPCGFVLRPGEPCPTHLVPALSIWRAVRSSAVGEDGFMQSFAGQFNTYLNIKSDDALKRAIAKVRYIPERVLVYNNGKAPEVCVIVQDMIQSVRAGTCFTSEPVTGERDRMVIEYVYGLGDKLVSGKVTPTTRTYMKDIHVIYPMSIGDAHILYCAKVIEDHFGCPQDIEWAEDAMGKLWILQARPITALPPIVSTHTDTTLKSTAEMPSQQK